jgi:hypothetical protein
MRGKRWITGVLAVGLSMLSAGPAVAHGARGHHRRHDGSRTVTVGGTVTTPHTYTLPRAPCRGHIVARVGDGGEACSHVIGNRYV